MEINISKEGEFLKWIKSLQLKGITHKNLKKTLFLDKKTNLMLKDNLIINSYKAPITNEKNDKFKLITKYLYIYKIPEFICKKDCLKIIDIINNSKLIRTGKGLKYNYYTDKKCVVENNSLITKINKKMITLTGNSKALPTLGMKYLKNDYKEKHFDNPWKFTKGNLEIGLDALKDNLITTWTFMIYLNNVKNGGETFFPNLNIKITPKMGTALIWNNLLVDGSINPYSEHQSISVKEDEKYIITKWFKSSLKD